MNIYRDTHYLACCIADFCLEYVNRCPSSNSRDDIFTFVDELLQTVALKANNHRYAGPDGLVKLKQDFAKCLVIPTSPKVQVSDIVEISSPNGHIRYRVLISKIDGSEYVGRMVASCSYGDTNWQHCIGLEGVWELPHDIIILDRKITYND